MTLYINMPEEDIIIKHIQLNIPFVYVKFGDGEFYAAIYRPGGNCDGTKYTQKLGNSIKNAFKYLITTPCSYIGKRPEHQVISYFESLAEGKPIRWIDFHVFMFDNITTFYSEKLQLYRSIRLATQQKIYVCNERNVDKSKKIFNINDHVIIHPQDWFENDFSTVFNNVCSLVKDPSKLIILISAGIGGKFLIKCLHIKYPSAIILDIGSAFDLLCGGTRSRDYHKISVEQCLQIESSILSEDSIEATKT